MDFKAYKKYTKARIGLGHFGPGLPTKEWLDFLYHHASAKDALYEEWDLGACGREMEKSGIDVQVLNSCASKRSVYLRHPQKGRILDEQSKDRVKSLSVGLNDLLVVVSNGLSSAAVNHHAVPFLRKLISSLEQENISILNKTIFFIKNARVAIIDDIGAILKPKIGLIVVGERPGLQSPDSLSVYLTYEPRAHKTDAERNCISNIRSPDGLSYDMAVQKTLMLIKRSMALQISGVNLKDDDRLFNP